MIAQHPLRKKEGLRPKPLALDNTRSIRPINKNIIRIRSPKHATNDHSIRPVPFRLTKIHSILLPG